jgi:nicotinamidase-related amidase
MAAKSSTETRFGALPVAGHLSIPQELQPVKEQSMSDSKREYMMKGQFTAENSVLVLVDYQVGTMQLIRTSSSDVCLRNAVMLATAAKTLNMPVVLTSSQEDRIQGPIAPALQKVLPDAFKTRVKRQGIVNAWGDSNFSGAIAATGRKNIIMGGVTTDICLVFPSISAVQEGYNVLAVMDAGGSSYEIQEEMAQRRMVHGGVVLTTTNTMVAELVQNWATPAGMQLIMLLLGSAPTMQQAS